MFQDLPRTYEGLVRILPPRPIDEESGLGRAIEMIRCLAGHDLNKDQDDYLEALSVFVEAYEEVHYPIDTSHITPLDSLKFLLEENGMSASDLGRLLGNRSLGSAILSGRRQLSKAHILKLAERFKVETSLFLQVPSGKPRETRVGVSRQARASRAGGSKKSAPGKAKPSPGTPGASWRKRVSV